MNTLDQERMRLIAENSHAISAHRHFGDDGSRALQSLIASITQIYRVVEPARLGKLVVFYPVMTDAIASIAKYDLSGSTSIGSELDQECLVEVGLTTRLKVFDLNGIDLLEVSKKAIIYEFDGGNESFLIAGSRYGIINPSSAHASVFSRPTFSSLEQALEQYRVRTVRSTSCFILEKAWAEPNRLFWRNKPEATMRRSLHQFLSNVFPDAEVRPEQIVDETHPVDIKITWHDNNRRALIEIKWIGKSRNEEGHVTTNYADARANEGAGQLAGYMDADHTAGPSLKSRGYLVVFDGRRRGLSESASAVNAADGRYYEHREIIYDPDYHTTRPDFAPPIRMFAEPVVT